MQNYYTSIRRSEKKHNPNKNKNDFITIGNVMGAKKDIDRVLANEYKNTDKDPFKSSSEASDTSSDEAS